MPVTNKLSLSDKEEIKKLYGTVPSAKLADKFGIADSTVHYWGNSEKRKNKIESVKDRIKTVKNKIYPVVSQESLKPMICLIGSRSEIEQTIKGLFS